MSCHKLACWCLLIVVCYNIYILHFSITFIIWGRGKTEYIYCTTDMTTIEYASCLAARKANFRIYSTPPPLLMLTRNSLDTYVMENFLSSTIIKKSQHQQRNNKKNDLCIFIAILSYSLLVNTFKILI